MPLQGLATFSDGTTSVVGIESASFVLSRGTQPSRGLLATPVVDQAPPAVGDLVFAYGDTTITLTDCRLAEASVDALGAPTLNLVVEDRRWRWSLADVVGRYNVRKGRDQIQYEQTPQQLATLIFEALGEDDFDVSAMPNEPRPYVDWRNERCDVALANLLAAVGCDVAPDLSDGSWVVFRLGVGGALPAGGGIEHAGMGVTPPPPATKIRQLAGDVRYQCKFTLEPVGLETDLETWLPIDDLSYKPAGGWAAEHEETFSGVTGTHIDDGVETPNQELALATVFRCYRINGVVGGGGEFELNPPGFEDAVEAGAPDIEKIDQLLPLLPYLNSIARTDDDESQHPQRPRIHGQWYDGNDRSQEAGVRLNCTRPGTRYKGAFSLDADRGIVHFGEPMVWVSSEGIRIPAELYLTAVCQADWVGLNKKFYYARERGDGDLVANSHSPEVILKYTASYTGAAGATLDSVTSNKAAVDEELNYYLDAFAAQLEAQTAATGSYADLVLANLDGAIEQIAWEVGPGGTTTRIGRFTRVNPFLPSYEEAQRAARIDRSFHLDQIDGEREPRGVVVV